MHRLRLVAVAGALLLAVTTTAVAQAQLPDTPTVPDTDVPATTTDPFEAGEGVVQDNQQIPDTDFTPRAKDAEEAGFWAQVHGARYPDDHVSVESVTDFRDSLYDVSFFNERLGYAGGARKVDCDGVPTDVPVMYRYGDTGGTGIGWTLDRIGDCDDPGYIGAIAWIGGSGEAVAVGGDGSYPYREPAYSEDCQVGEEDPVTGVFAHTEAYGVLCDRAGDARAWQMLGGRWREITEDLPSDANNGRPRGMTALEFARNGRSGFAGALGQIWRWQGEGFDRLLDMHSECPRSKTVPDEEPDVLPVQEPDVIPDTGIRGPAGVGCDFAEADRFRFRVREIRFSRETTLPHAFAVTDGCCAEDALHNTPSLLAYGPEGVSAPYRWHVATLDPVPSFVFDEGSGKLAEPPPSAADARRLNSRQDMPDSFYSLTILGNPGTQSTRVSAVAAPAAPEDTAPERSFITQPYCTALDGSHYSGFFAIEEQATVPDQLIEALRARLSTVRLVAGDGDDAGSFSVYTAANRNDFEPGHEQVYGGPSEISAQEVTAGTCTTRTNRNESDGIPDWAVGELRSTREDFGSQGAAYSSVLRPGLLPETLRTDPDLTRVLAGDPPTDERKVEAYLRSQLLAVSSYSLNAIDVLDSGEGWAVGEHGAILHEGGGDARQSGSGAEPDPPRLSSRPAAPLPATGAYDSARPPDASVGGPVPSVAARPRLELERHEAFPAGSPFPASEGGRDPIEDVQQLVMSRDGSEGWAIGSSRLAGQSSRVETTSLAHYDGEAWGRCDPVGVEGLVPPDRACEELAPLRDYHNTLEQHEPVKLMAAARVPLEYDGDPSNDDELKIVAVTSPYQLAEEDAERSGLVTYENGRWRPEPFGEFNAVMGGSGWEPRSVEFAAPDDGWVLVANNALPPASRLLHFDGERWMDCTPASGDDIPSACGDPGCPEQGLLCFRTADPECVGQGIAPDPPPACATVGERATDVIRGMVSSGRDLFVYGSRELEGSRYPFVIRRDASGTWSADSSDGALDPVALARNGGQAPPEDERGEVQSLALAPGADGRLDGWAVGTFSTRSIGAPRAGAGAGTFNYAAGGEQARLTPQTSLMRLESGEWGPFDDSGPVADYLTPRQGSTGNCTTQGRCEAGTPDTSSNLQVTLPGTTTGFSAFVAQGKSGRLFGFDPEHERWELVDQPRSPGDVGRGDGWLDGPMKALAADGEGGVWAVAGDMQSNYPHDDFMHVTRRPPAPVLTEAPSPLRDGESFTSLTGAADGTAWATLRDGALLRYDRILGWDRISIPGWDPGRVVTRPSRAAAVALAPTGEGIVVGERGRIANLSSSAVGLDRAAGTSCALGGSAAPPCGTGFDLLTAAVAPGGSAIAAGERLSVVWRPENDAFRTIAPPPGNPFDAITGVAMPRPGEAYVATDSGQIFRGTGGTGGWSWVRENRNLRGDIITLDNSRTPIPLRAITVDASGHGYAVGDDGILLERVGSGETAWRRLRTPFADDLTSVALPVAGGEGALIGGRNGLVLAADGDRVSLVRPADHFNGSIGAQSGQVVGLASVPGDAPGETEAWVALAGADPSRGDGDYNNSVGRLLHYASDPSDPWLNPDAHAGPLPDSPPARDGELSFAAMGRAECRLGSSPQECLDVNGSRQDFEVALKRAVDEIADRASRPGGPAFALFTGDSVDTASTPGTQETERQFDIDGSAGTGQGIFYRHQTFSGPRKLRRFREVVSSALSDSGVPLLAAPGGQDLGSVRPCSAFVGCPASTRGTAGDNLAWRQAFESEPGPWGGGDPPEARSPAGEGLSFEPIADSADSVRPEDQDVPDPDQALPGGDGPLAASELGTGGASTHYALDILRDGEIVARLVVADTSLRSLQASDPLQQPAEQKGQLLWLDRMTCIEGQVATDGTSCTRKPGQQAIVLTNTPTYSYGPGALTDTNTADGTQLEQILIQNGVTAVVSGRLGWNGLYYATAPGLHTPCAGDPYPSGPPTTTAPDCGDGPEEAPDPVTTALNTKAEACETVSGAGAPDPTGCAAGTGNALGRVLPFVVASSAAGTFGPDGTQTGPATEGYWHGYSIVRLSPDGDPVKTIVEQRPVFDWIQVQPRRSQGDTHTIRAGKKLDLVGVGREPIAASTAVSREQTTRYDEISTPAITHRFDLLEADSAQPWMPKQGTRADACDPYDCVSSSVATIDTQTGQVQAQNGNYPRTFAIAQLSVGERSATYPLVFEPRASFKASPPPLPAPVAVPPPASPPAPAQPTAPSVNLPAAPVLPVLTAQALAPPPLPPAPPTFASEAPLDLNLSPAALDVTPPTAVSQPPTPPVNPAPPGGARKEARQRQAAAQKSGADSAEGDARDEGVDLASSPPSADGSTSMTRHDFTALAHREQPSAWARDALLGGGLGIAALILALGVTGRPTPRRREPELPAPAWARQRHR